MIIYVDLVFLLNIFLDFILLMSVSVILTRNVKIKRILFGSVIGGMSTILLYIPINSYLSVAFKLILGLLMVLVTFGFKSIKYTFNNLFYLYTTSFIVGGVLFLLMNKGIYNYFILIIGFIIICFLYIKQVKNFKNNYNNYFKVKIIIKNSEYNLVGYLDTGNNLYDNYKHRPVILISKRIQYKDEDIIYVNYVSLNNESVLRCLKADKVIINGKVFKNYLIGLSNKKFKIEGIDCILHNKMKGDLYV